MPLQRGLTLERWLAWFETLHPKQIDLSLDRLIAVLDELGLRSPSYTVITVAGTNGKGSCVAMLESIYWHAGYAVGTFTSPHLWRFNERIRFDGVDAPDRELVEVFEGVAAALGPITLSYFEASFVAALSHFGATRPKSSILEVGMGGRLDATNTIDSDCALIVSIDLDHREWLGETREDIGREKAGIVRRGKPVVIGDRAVPRSVLEHAAAQGRDTGADRPRLRFSPRGLAMAQGTRCRCGAVTAVAAVRRRRAIRQCGFMRGGRRGARRRVPVTDAALAAGIANAYLRGRLERHEVDGVEWVVDVGHNPAAAAGSPRRSAACRPPRALDRVRRHARQGSRRRRRAVRRDGRRLVRRAGERGSRRDGR